MSKRGQALVFLYEILPKGETGRPRYIPNVAGQTQTEEEMIEHIAWY